MVTIIAKLVARRAWWILGLTFIISILCATGIQRIQIKSFPIETYFTNPNSLIQSVALVRKTFNFKDRIVMVSIEAQDSHSVLDPAALQIMHQWVNTLKSSPIIKKETLLSLSSVQQIRNGSNGIESYPLIDRAPKNEKELDTLKNTIKKNDFIYGRLISKNFKTALVIAQGDDQIPLTEYGNTLKNDTAQLLNQSTPGFKVTLAGDTQVQYHIEQTAKHDNQIFMILAFGFIILSFYLIFRSWKGVLIPLIANIISILWTLGTMGFITPTVSILSGMIPVVVIIVGSSYFIHLYRHLIESPNTSFETTYRQILKKLFRPVTLSALTTILGGVSLLTIKLSHIQHFGIFMAVSTFYAYIITIFILPVLFKVFQKPITVIETGLKKGITTGFQAAEQSINIIPIAGKLTTHLAKKAVHNIHTKTQSVTHSLTQQIKKITLLETALERLSHFVIRYKYLVVGFYIALGIASLFALKHLEVGFYNIELLPNNSNLKQTMYRLQNDFKGLENLEIMIDTASENGALEPSFLKRVDQFQEEALNISGVSRTFSILHILKKLHRTLNEIPNSDSKAPVGKYLPESRAAAAQYLLVASSESGLNLSTLINSDHSKIKLAVTIENSDSKTVELIYKNLKKLSSKFFNTNETLHFSGEPIVSVAILKTIVWGKIQNVLALLLMLFFLVSIAQRSLTLGLISIVTLPIGALANFGLMSVCGIRFDYITAIITSFAMGTGVDYTFHLLLWKDGIHRHQNLNRFVQGAVVDAGQSILYNAAVTIIGFGVLLFSNFSAIQTFSKIMCFNMAFLALASITLVPAVILISKPELIVGRKVTYNPVKRKWRRNMKLAFSSVITILLVIGLVWTDTQAAESPSAILKKSLKAVYTQHEESIYVMKITDSSGGTKTRKMRLWFKSPSESEAKLLIKFIEPADISGTGFLTLSSKDSGVDQWVYLPALKKSRRIKGGNPDEPFLGSDFAMGDISADRDDGLSYQLTGETKCGDHSCTIITGTPKAGTNVNDLKYSKKIYYIRKGDYLTDHAEFFNSNGKLEKVMTLSKSHKEGSRWLVDGLTMKNLITGSSTTLENSSRDSKKEIGDHIFTVNQLER